MFPTTDVDLAPASTTLAVCDAVRPLSPDFAWFAAECRAAGLAFIEGASGWGKRELAAWLRGPYGVLAVQRDTPAETPSVTPPSSRSTRIEEATLADLMSRTRSAVVGALIDLANGEWDAVTHAMSDGTLEPARARADLVWLPVDRPRMRLEARVLSLFLVDYLFDPDAYEGDFSWCAPCDDLTFDGACLRCGSPESQPSYVRELAPSLARTAKNG